MAGEKILISLSEKIISNKVPANEQSLLSQIGLCNVYGEFIKCTQIKKYFDWWEGLTFLQFAIMNS